MGNLPPQGESPSSLLSLSQLGGRILGIYSVANAVLLLLLLNHALPEPLEILLALALVGPLGLVFAILLIWSNTARPGRSGMVLALLLLGVAALSAIHLLLYMFIWAYST